MFGDVGQGLVIALVGGLFFKKTQNMLGKIAVYIGIVSSIAGVFYGSFLVMKKFFVKRYRLSR